METREEEPRANRQSSVIIGASIVVAAIILSFGSGGGAPAYQLTSSEGLIARLDNDSGAVIVCDRRGCAQLIEPARAATLRPVTNLLNGGGEQRQLPARQP